MPFLTKTTDFATRKLPKFISPSAHKSADYLIMGGFAGAGIVYWRKNRGAAVASLFCAGSMLALISATAYRGRKGKLMGFPQHRKLESGMATAFAFIPELLDMGRMAKAHFAVQAAVLAAIGNLTECNAHNQPQ